MVGKQKSHPKGAWGGCGWPKISEYALRGDGMGGGRSLGPHTLLIPQDFVGEDFRTANPGEWGAHSQWVKWRKTEKGGVTAKQEPQGVGRAEPLDHEHPPSSQAGRGIPFSFLQVHTFTEHLVCALPQSGVSHLQFRCLQTQGAS